MDFGELGESPAAAAPAATDGWGAPAAANTVEGGSADAAAAALLANARGALTAGRFEDARSLALEAWELKADWPLYAPDSPERVLSEVAAKTKTVTFTPKTAPAAQPTAEELARGAAADALAAARDAIADGAFDQAEAYVGAAEAAGVGWGVLQDSPETVRAELAAARAAGTGRTPNVVNNAAFDMDFDATFGVTPTAAQSPALSVSEGGESTPEAVSSAPADDLFAAPPVDPYAAPAAAPVAATPAGPSARGLYDEGMTALKAGDRGAALASFLACHEAVEAGGPLDAFRKEQMQSFLVSLAPAGGTGVTPAAAVAPQVAADMAVRDASGQSARQRMDLVNQAENVRFDKLRGEVLNAIFRAERLKEADNVTEARAVLARTKQSVETAELRDDLKAPMLRHIANSSAAVEGYAKQMAPKLELAARNDREGPDRHGDRPQGADRAGVVRPDGAVQRPAERPGVRRGPRHREAGPGDLPGRPAHGADGVEGEVRPPRIPLRGD